MNTVGIAKIKHQISSIVNRVAFGRERIILTSRGKPKAALVSLADLEKLEMQENTSAASPAQQKAALEMAQAVRQMTLVRRKGEPFTDISDDLNSLREARDFELSSLR